VALWVFVVTALGFSECFRARAPACAILMLLFAAGAAQRCLGQSQEDEYRVKAAFLFHFGELADWPAGTFASDKQTFNVCTLGYDPFLGELEDTVGGKTIGTRMVKVQHLKLPQDAMGCQILFFGAGAGKSLSTILSQLGNDPILTVGENDEFLQQGGMIHFFLEDNKIRFDINLDAADRAGLKIGARLLLLARNVVGSRKGG
jgi:hypothetical protein